MPSILNATTTNGLVTSADNSGSLQLQTNNGTTAVTIDTSQRVGIGTSSPDTRLQVGGGIVGSNATFPGTIQVNENPSSLNQTGGIEFKTGTFGSGYGWKIASIDPGGGTPLLVGFRDNNASWTEALRLDSGGNLRFNSGYGSVATAYGCRAWVNFNGQGTVAIRASGNVSSITDNGTGAYGVNFTTAMPNVNYSVVGMCNNNQGNDYGGRVTIADGQVTTTYFNLFVSPNAGTALFDSSIVCASVFR